MAESIIPNVRGITTLNIETELRDSKDVVVSITNQGVHTVSLVSLVLVRHFANGSQTVASYGQGFEEPLPVEKDVLHRNHGTNAVIKGGPKVVGAQAMATYIEVTGVAISEFRRFGGDE